MRLTNVTGISLPLAVWLATDGYDFTAVGKSISATSLMKPPRQILLKERLTETTTDVPDVSEFIASRLGHTIHDGIERAWTDGYKDALRKLGYPEQIISKVEVNPEVPTPGGIHVWLEQRSSKQIMGYTISGKFDMVLEGVIQDFKSTSVYTHMLGSKDEDYCIQGSIYRWLNPDKITEDHINIQFIFTDWSKAMSRSNPNYPQQRVLEHSVELMSLKETEAWIRGRITNLEKHADMPEEDIPHCTDKELWRSDPVHKYFSNPDKTDGKSSKNFKILHDATAYQGEKGKGVVISIPGKVKACSYCPAFNACTQKDLYDHD